MYTMPCLTTRDDAVKVKGECQQPERMDSRYTSGWRYPYTIRIWGQKVVNLHRLTETRTAKDTSGTSSARMNALEELGSKRSIVDDVRALNAGSKGKPFDYVLAVNYLTRALGNLSGRGTAGRTEKGRERDSIHGRKAEKTSKGKDGKRRKVSSGSHVQHVDINTVYDLAQEAFLIFWQGEGADRTTRRACKFALLKHLQGQRGQAAKDRGTLVEDYARHLDYWTHDHTRWNYRYEHSDTIYATIVAWLETGASQSDVARELGIPRQRVSEFIAHMRTTMSKHVDEYPQTTDQKPKTLMADMPASAMPAWKRHPHVYMIGGLGI